MPVSIIHWIGLHLQSKERLLFLLSTARPLMTASLDILKLSILSMFGV